MVAMSAVLGLTACAATEPRKPRPPAANALPFVKDPSARSRYADLFGAACIGAIPDFRETARILENSGFRKVSGAPFNFRAGGVWSDGIAEARLDVTQTESANCSVSIRSENTDADAAELERVVRRSRFGVDVQPTKGLAGTGFQVSQPKTILFTIARRTPAAQPRISFTVNYIN